MYISKLEKIFLILQFFVWFIIFIGRYILIMNISPELLGLLTKANINQFAILDAVKWGIIAQFYFLLFYFFLSVFVRKRNRYKVFVLKYKLNNFIFQKILLIFMLFFYVVYFTISKVNQSVLEAQGRLLTDLIFFHLPVYLSIYLVYKDFNKKNIFLSLIIALLASLSTGSKSYFIYTLLSIFIIYIIKFNIINKKLILLGIISIAVFINFMNIYRSSVNKKNDFSINFLKIYISLFNRFNGLDYLSTVPKDFEYSFNRFEYWPISLIPRKLYKDKPIFSASLLLNKKYNSQVGNMLVSYTFIVGIRNMLLLIFNMFLLALLFKIFINNSFFKVAFIYNLFFFSAFWEQDIFTFYTYGIFKLVFLSLIGTMFFKLKFKKDRCGGSN